MAELLIPVDVELTVKRELDASLVGTRFAGAKVGTKIPQEPKPPMFVRVLATGGASRDLVTDEPTFVVEGYAVDETTAHDLTAYAVAVLERAARVGTLGGETCHTVRVASLPQNYPHPTVNTHFRFTVTVSAALRRTTV